MSYPHIARQGFITKNAIPSVTRQRGPVDYACSLLVSGLGKNNASNTLLPIDAVGTRSFLRALTPFPVNATPYWPDGQWSNYFSGSSQWFSIPSSTSLDFGTGDFTIEFWMFPTSITSQMNVLATGGAFGTGASRLGKDFSFGMSLYTRTSVDNILVSEGSNTFISSAANKWTHYAFVRSGTTFTLYRNGVSVGTGTSSVAVSFALNGSTVVGTDWANDYWPGYLSNLRVVKGTAVYTSNFTPSTTPLTAISGTSLLTCQSNRFKDNSSNNFAITVTGTPTAQPVVPFDPPASPTSYGGTIYQTGTARQAYYANPVPITTGEFCIELWCNPENFSAAREFVSSRAWNTGNNKGWGTQISNTGKVLLLASQSVWNSFPTIITSTTSLVANAWNHVVIQRDSSNVIKIFINGVQDASTVTYASSLDQSNGSFGTHYFVVGNAYSDGQFGTSPFNGYIGDVRIGTGTGSAIYSAPFTPPTATLAPTTGTLVCANSSAFVVESSGHTAALIPVASVNQVAHAPFGSAYPGSFYFNGTDSYITSPARPDFSFGTGDFTVECWVYYPPVANTNGKIIADARPTSTNGSYWLFGVGNTGVITFVTMSSGGTSISDTQARPNQWVHYAVTRQGTTLRLFANGTLAASTTDASNILSSGLAIGKNAFSSIASDTFWLGNITNFHIVKGSALYTSNFTPSTTPIAAVSGTSLLLLADNVGIADSSASALAVSSFGTIKISNTQSKYGGTSLYLDGSTGYASIANATAIQLTTAMFQVEFWMYPMANGRWITGKGNTTGTSGWGLYISNVGNTFYLQVGGTLYNLGYAVTLNQWAHVAFTRDLNNVMRVFVDGVLRYSVTNATSFTQTESLFIGGARDLTAKFQGYISDYRIFRDGAQYIVDFTVPSENLPTTSPCYRGFTNTVYGDFANFGAGAVQNLVTRSAAPSVSRYRGTAPLITQSLVTGVGSVGSQVNKLDFIDASTNALAITRSGTPRRGSAAPYRDSGYWGTSFDGAGDYLSIVSSSLLSFTGDFTLEAWVYLTLSPAGSVEIVSKHVTGTTGWYSLGFTSGRVPTMTIWDSTNASNTASAGSAIPLNTWTHVSGGRNGSTVFVSINGTYTSTALTVTPRTTNGIVSLGINSNLSSFPFEGLMSNVRLSNTARYTASFTPATAPFTVDANTVVLTCNSGSFWDDSANKLQLTLGGNVAPTQDNPWVTGATDAGVGAVTFDGSSDYLNTASTAVLDLTSGDWTCEGWFWPSAWKSGDTWVFGKDGQSGVTYEQYCVHVNSSRKLVGAVGSGASGAGEQKVIGTTTVQLGCWYHFAFVKSGTTLYLFLNGKLETSATQTFTMTHGTYPLRVGGQNNTTACDWTGMITGLRIVKGTALYTANFTPSTTPLTAVAGTSFLLNPEPYTKDLSGKNTPLRFVGNITQVPFSPFGSAYPGSYHCPAIAGAANTQGINMPMVSSQLLYLGTQDFTVECWIYVVNTGSMYGDVFYWSNPRSGATHMRIGDVGFGSKLQCATNDTSTSTVYTTPNTRATLANRWVHCALTRQSGVTRIFVDGVQQNVNTGINPSTYPLSSWTDNTNLQRGTFNFGGGIGGYLAFPHVVLGQALYTASFTKPTAPPTPVSGTIFYAPAQNYGLIDGSYQGTQQSMEITNASSVVITNASAPSGQSTSFDFDGTRSVVVADNANNNFDFGAQAWTIEAFVRFTASGQMTIAGSGLGGIASDWFFSRSSTGALQIGRSVVDMESASLTWDTNTWYHVAATKDGSATRTLRLYRDGVLLASSTAFLSADYSNQNGTIQLGAKRTGTTTSGEYMIGNIASFRVIKGTAAYIFDTYTIPTPPLDASASVPATVTNALYGVYRAS